MFYDCEVGPAAFQAPDGRIQGELTKKRQFKIRGGKMEYALETSSHIQDDVLQKELSHTSDEKMKSIISTIQKEQNRIIRNENQGTMILQGVAGSGDVYKRQAQELLVYLAQSGVEIATLQEDGLYKNTWNENPDQLEKAAKVFQF